MQILRLNGLTLAAALGQAQVSQTCKKLNQLHLVWTLNSSNPSCGLQGTSLLPQILLQQQPEVLLTPQMVNLNPQMAGPFAPQGPQLFFPSQGNQLTPVIVPNGQQEQAGTPQDPNAPNIPQQAQNPVQVGEKNNSVTVLLWVRD